MHTVILVIHLMLAVAMIAVVLLQRSEGGALGIGGGGGAGGFMTGRGAANLLTRTTAILAAAFFLTSIILTMLVRQGPGPSIFQGLPGQNQGGSALPNLQPISPGDSKQQGGSDAPKPPQSQ